VKRILKIIALTLLLGFIAIQFKRPDHTNPPENAADTMEARLTIPPDVKTILDRSCADCHSHRTVWPFYSHIAPIGWNVSDHVRDGRKELNFSVWGTYEPRRQRRKLYEMCEEVKSAAMPLPQYLYLHRDAKMSPQDTEKLCNWTKAEEEKLKATLEAQPEK
jgi:hypothetical protein